MTRTPSFRISSFCTSAFRLSAVLISTCLLLATAATAQETTSTKIFPYQTHVEHLDNGLQVVLIPMSSNGLVAYWTIVRTGARDEYEPGRTGFAHFFEHMMFRGTEKYPSTAYDDMVTKIGADANAFTSDDLTAYYLNIAAEDLETVMEIESDRFLNLSYPKDLFQTEAGAVYGEYRKNKTSPFFVLFEETLKAAYTTHTYGHTAMGYEEDIQQMPNLFDYSKTFFGRYYRPENAVLVIVGDIEVETTRQLVKDYYSDWEAGYVPPKVPVEPPQTQERRISLTYPGRTLPLLLMAYKADAFDAQDVTQAGARLLCDLGFGETSDIYKKLVLDEQLVEFISAEYDPSRDPGLVTIVSRIKDEERVDDVIAEIDRTVTQLQQQPPDPKRLADLKSRLKYGFLMNLDTPANVMSNLVRLIAVTGDITTIDDLYRTFDKVTAEDVQQAAQKYLVTEQRTVAVLRGDS